MSFQTSALIVTWVALLLLACVVAGLVRQVHALSAGGTAPARGIGPGDVAAGLDLLGVRPPAVLLFVRSTCSTCSDVIAETVEVVGGSAPVLALHEGRAPEPPPGVAVLGDQERLFAAYGAVATPFAVVVGPDGRVTAAAPVGSRAAVRGLLAPVRSREAP